MIIYKTTNLINNKIYIGQDSKNNSEYLGSGVYLNCAIKKYGKENFKKEILCKCNSREELNEKEIYFIKELNSTNPLIGYNLSNGGQGSSFWEYYKINDPEKYKQIKEKIGYASKNRTPETLEKIRKANLGKKYSDKVNKSKGLYGSLNSFYNKKHSDETKQKISNSKKGKQIKENNPFYGKHHSEKTRKILSLRTKIQYAKKKNNLELIEQYEQQIKELI